jgi:hypothetical protein
MPNGAFRKVFLLGPWALKLPRIKNFAGGLRCNRWERETWDHWRPIFGWDGLCPILASDPIGLFVLMPRAFQPVSQAEADSALPDHYPAVWCEGKPQDYGRLGARVVVLDYGIPYADFVVAQRCYLSGVAAR